MGERPRGPLRHSSGSLGETPLELSVHNGQRILSLDGGGLKGLILIEVLIYIEKLTGKKIVELFDWIVGSSTGGVIALALVYGKSLVKSTTFKTPLVEVSSITTVQSTL